MVTPKTLVHNLSATRALLPKSQHPIIAPWFIRFFLEPILHNFTSSWIVLLVVVAFETEFFVANAFDILLRYKISFSAQVFTSNLRTPSRVLVVIGVISVVPKHILSMVIKITRFSLASWEKLQEHRVRNHNIALSLLARRINTLAPSLNLLLQIFIPRVCTKLMPTNKTQWFHLRIIFIKVISPNLAHSTVVFFERLIDIFILTHKFCVVS